MSTDGKTTIKLGDRVDFDEQNLPGSPGEVVSIVESTSPDGDLIAWRDARGEAQYAPAGKVQVISAANRPRHRLSADNVREIEIGDLVNTDGHSDDLAGIVVGILPNEDEGGDLIVYKDLGGVFAAWNARDVEIIRKRPLAVAMSDRVIVVKASDQAEENATPIGGAL